ncbi:MAG: GNAT family N-acetyltransferase [Potamolinea sp.]
MTTLKIRPHIGERKHPVLAEALPRTPIAKLFAPIVDLVKLNDATGQLDDDTLVWDLQGFFDSPNVDKARDLRFWKDSTGKLIGFGQLLISQQKDEISSYLYFDVHPTWHGEIIETEILQWSEQRMHEIGKDCTLPIKLHTCSRDDKILRRVLLERQGFTTERSFLTMACSLNQDFCSSSLPSGFRLQQLSWEQNIEAWVELFNESFIDHWNHQDLTVATARDEFKNQSYLPELNLIAVAPDGTFAAFCLGYINWEENARSGRKEGWIKLLGTRQNFRKLGLGKAMLIAAIKQLKAMGIEQVKLGVDAQNLTSATRLYESVGFHPVNTWLSYFKDI